MRTVSIAFLTALAACGSAPEPAPAEKAATAAVEAPAEPAVQLPPPPRYVGRWAESADQCTEGWWRFWHDELLTKAGMRCDILPPDVASGDEMRRMVCQSGGKWSREEWTLAYPSANTMTVSRDGGAPTTFGKC
ncbi:hypothetical protein [Sphingosinicella soli]|uniref:Uncharacterized protein n=1 Tax=Sphingosinicella soli TaxID=333708 RepID=A0A7W7F5T7_9SPHN|nr:hypothetical protein [Sphingosinicella soli]MBB4630994.1 hypothetical protein [Sphingosinicella soli]